HRTLLKRVSFTAGGKNLLTHDGDSKVGLWEVGSGHWVKELAPPAGTYSPPGFVPAPDGRLLAGYGEDGSITVRETAGGTVQCKLPGKRNHCPFLFFS